MRRALTAVILGSSILLQPSAAQSMGMNQATRTKVIELLASSPLLEPTMSVVHEAQFVRESQAQLDAITYGTTAKSPSTAREATAELEALLAGLTVKATVTSVPRGLVVSYHRLVDTNALDLTVTTDDVLTLEPALYVFTCKDPKTGRLEEHRTSCAGPCKVSFTF